MKKHFIFMLFVLLFLSLINSCTKQENWDDAFAFIATADMRNYAMKKYRTSQHFLGLVEAVRDVGKGAFTISTGDIDPPHAVREVISQVLGDDYPWYPVPGNHEMETEQDIQWLQEYNKNLPHIINNGPPGTEQLNYSFDWGDCHFVVLNQYYDGTSINGTDGDIVPTLLNWLEKDLSSTNKKFIFIFGHEPIISIPDMDNGRIRHQGDSLDKYPKNAFRFHQMLLKYKVKAYVCGHTHSVSYSKINGLWQLDTGHSRGIEEDSEPTVLFNLLSKYLEEEKKTEQNINVLLKKYYSDNAKQVKKTLFYLKFFDVTSYNDIKDEQAIDGFIKFYHDFNKGADVRQQYIEKFWQNCEYRKSTFMKIFIGREQVKVEIYRDDAHGGKYTLRHALILD